MSEQTFPWRERDDYAISAWLNDLLNIIKKRGYILDKNSAMMIFVENADLWLECYVEGMSPMEAFSDYDGSEE
jgi:hypothetical protein